MEHIKSLGIHVLSNRSMVINQTINLAGVMDMMGRRFDFEPPDLTLALSNVAPSLPTILLSHQPKIVSEIKHEKIDLILSGHTHGGQVTLFGLYAPVIPSAYGQRFRSGLRHTTAGIPVIITNGIGTSRKSVRLFAPSEVVLIRLVALQ